MEMNKFFATQHDWVATVVRDGQSRNDIRQDIGAVAYGKMIVASLEGAMMVSRGNKQPEDLKAAVDLLVRLVRR